MKVIAITRESQLNAFGKPIVVPLVPRAADDVVAGAEGIGIEQAICNFVRDADTAADSAQRQAYLRISVEAVSGVRRYRQILIRIIGVRTFGLQALSAQRIIERLRHAGHPGAIPVRGERPSIN